MGEGPGAQRMPARMLQYLHTAKSLGDQVWAQRMGSTARRQ